LPFEDLRRKSLINPNAQSAGDGADFSERIRKDVPTIKR
jgi:hypothetical protein